MLVHRIGDQRPQVVQRREIRIEIGQLGQEFLMPSAEAKQPG